MLHSLQEKRVPPKIFGKSHFFRELCHKRVFRVLVITNVIHTIFYSPSSVMSLATLPFHTSSPQDFRDRKNPNKQTKNQTNHKKFLPAPGRKCSSFPSQI